MKAAEEIKKRIEDYCRESTRDAVLLRKAQRGEVGTAALASYLLSLQYTLGASPGHLELARKLALESDSGALANYFHTKWLEECGHDRWAANDLEVLHERFGTADSAAVLPSAVALMEFVEATIRREPHLYISYILFAEYMTVLVGPAWVSALCEGGRYPREALTVVDKHVLADSAHAAEGFAQANQLIESPAEALEVLAESMRLFSLFTEEVAAIPN